MHATETTETEPMALPSKSSGALPAMCGSVSGSKIFGQKQALSNTCTLRKLQRQSQWLCHLNPLGRFRPCVALSLGARFLDKNRVLRHGTLQENQITDGNQLVLVPNMETGTNSMKADSRVMQALESLTEVQVNDFLTGRAPLLLAMKLGEHMMFVQLQLSASSCTNRQRLHTHPPAHCSHVTNGQSEKPRSCNCSVTSGAVIDSVNHLGQGVYSGTFSGTLDPSSSDSTGKPKRDINTILQILNDLLMASPQFRQYAQCSTEPFCNPSMHRVSQNLNTLGLSQNHVQNSEEDNLRGKVQSLQRMMLERKLRRQMKRGMRAPYSWSDRRSPLKQVKKSTHQHSYESSKGRDLGKKIESHTAAPTADAGFPATGSALEHEGVLV